MVRKSGKKKRPPRISDSEWIVMKPFWDDGAMAARDLYDAVSASQDWSYTTVKTMLSRLVKKGALDYTQVGNSYLYSPCFSRDEMVRTEVKSFSHRVLDGSLKPFLVGFFDGRNPSREELSTLKEMIGDLEGEAQQGKKGKGGTKS
jgi:BlaI family penicillinase repressor